MKQAEKKCACEGATLTRFIQPLVLAELSQKENYGYRILQKISNTAMWNGEAPDSAGLYRVLRDMEKRNLLTSRIDAPLGAGMNKRVFTITEQGRHCLGNWLETLCEYRENLDKTIVMLQNVIAFGDQ